MKVLIYIFFLSMTFAQDKEYVVAVGEAELAKDKLHFNDLNYDKTSGIKTDELSVGKEFIQILKDDFNFYKHKFEVSEKMDDSTYDVDVSLKFSKEIILGVVLKLKNSTLYQYSEKLYLNNIRTQAHQVAHEMYQKMTGKESIFNSKIYFLSDRHAKGSKNVREIYRMDFDGQRPQRITYKDTLIISPSVSPDGSKVLYSVVEAKWKKGKRGHPVKTQNINLYLFNLKTKKQKAMSTIAGINSGAMFSSDGKDIYLTISHQKNADIYRMNLQTRAKKRLTKHPLDDVDPHINEDGSLMAFLSGRSGRAMIYTLDTTQKNAEPKRISFVGRFNATPRFSPDGKEIVFSSWLDGKFDLFRVGADRSNLVRLTKDFGSNEEPWYSPDGEFIVFSSQVVKSRTQATQVIWVMNREGEVVRKLTSEVSKSFTPRWVK